MLEHGFASGPGHTVSTFAYTPAGQLSSETRTNDGYAWTGSVAVSRPYSVNGQNQYVAAGPASFDYDPNGNLVAALNAPQSTTYIYDIENRLVQASGGSNAALFYDPLGRLFQVWSPDSGATTRFLHDGDELVAEYDGSGTLLRRYIHGDDDDDPLYWFEGPGLDKPRFPHADRQGSIVATAGPGATVLAINSYDEYGIPGPAQRDWTALGSHGRFQYTGQAWIPEIGMYYYKARIYSPTLGRFLQVDPIGYDDQVNLYAYVANDPLNGKDPTGEAGEGITEALVGALRDRQLQSRIDSASSPGVRESRALDARADASANGRASEFDYGRQASVANAQVNREMANLYRNGNTPSQTQLEKFAQRQGWKTEGPNSNGIVTYTSRSANPSFPAVNRLVIKPEAALQSTGALSQGPRISFRSMYGTPVNPLTGTEVKSKASLQPLHIPFRPRRRP